MNSSKAGTPPSLSAVRAAVTPAEFHQLVVSAKTGLLEDLYLVGLTDEVVAAELRAMVEPTLTWTHSMYAKGLQALMQESGQERGQQKQQQLGAHEDVFLTGVENSEESVCSAMLGMKGQIDLVARARIVELAQPVGAGAGAGFVGVSAAQLQQVAESALPVEIKTGKWRASTAIGHRAQVG